MLLRNPKYILDFLFPPTCVLCDARIDGGGLLCPDCLDCLSGSMQPAVLSGHGDFHHIRGVIHFDRVLVGWEYSPEIEELIHRVKYERGIRMARLLGRLLGQGLAPWLENREDRLLIPVPLHRTRKRERGYNQSELLCRGLTESAPERVRTDLLVRRKNTPTQTRLDAEARQRNVRDAFSVTRPEDVRGRMTLVADDVCTTGATLNSCARCLRDAGATGVMGITLARPGMD